jgi:SAM-dependent methyltransferase
MTNLQEQFGQIDIYLLDQILRGRIARGLRIFDAGCGSGRNLFYFLCEGYEVFGADADPLLSFPNGLLLECTLRDRTNARGSPQKAAARAYRAH